MTETAATSVTGATRLLESLERLGVELVFGLPGVHNLPIWKALSESDVRLAGVRHEQTAVYAADGYARTTGRLGVAVVTTGPGAANTLGATGEAMASGSPVLVIATDIATTLRREGVYGGTLHETRDQTAMFRPVTKGARLLAGAEEIAGAVLESGSLALTAPTGPVYLGVPTDLLRRELPAGGPAIEVTPARVGSPESLPAAAALDRASELLATAERPLIWAGGGALRAGAGPLVGELARKLAAPVITTFNANGLLVRDHPCAVAGPVHAPEVGALWDESDVVLAIGSDFDGTMTQNWQMPAPPRLISINVDHTEASKNFRPELILLGDARAVLEQLVPRVEPRDGLGELEARLAAIGCAVAAGVESDDPQAAAFLEIVHRALPTDAVVVTDMCIPGYWLGGYWQAPKPRKLGYPLGWGTLGFGFPASLGAALAGAGPTICVCGDGGFMYACGELATVVQERIPLTIVLVNDGGYGMLRFDQIQAGEDPFGVDLVNPDFPGLARAFGIPVRTVHGFGPDFERALRSSVAAGEPQMIEVYASLKPPPTTSPRWYRKPQATARGS
ncbi:MAG: thiamine pyrophosphate-binding protein [Solirubrobacterales bacterium]|nr:thiamine pyrophosphate-binding protein [Solirubrobacterales bacterium]